MRKNKLKIATLLCACMLAATTGANAQDVSNFSELQQAINNSVSNIVFTNSITSEALLQITNGANITISSAAKNYFTSNDDSHQAFSIGSGASAVIDNLIFDNYKPVVPASSGGGAIYSEGNLTVKNSEFNDITLTTSTNSGGYGGGIYSKNGNLTVEDSSFTGNNAVGGAGINVGSMAIGNLTNVTFTNNTATRSGGGLTNAGTTDAFNLTFTGNKAEGTSTQSTNNGSGGAIENTGDLELSGTNIFSTNTAVKNGGAIVNAGSAETSLSMYGNATFENNTASSGGAIYNNATAYIGSTENNINVKFYGNTSSSSGGAIYNGRGANLYIVGNSIFGETASGSTKGNTATGDGGAIYNAASASVILGGTASFAYNEANNGGAIYNAADIDKDTGNIYNVASLSLIGTAIFSNNKANTKGGAIYSIGSIYLDGTTSFENNTSEVAGGAIYNVGDLTITGTSTFKNNSNRSNAGSQTDGDGGGAINNKGNLTIIGTRDSSTGNSSILFQNNGGNAGTNAFAKDGGAILVQGTSANPALMNMQSVDFIENKGARGGALRGGTNVTINLDDVKFVNNRGNNYGGAFSSSNDNTEVHIANSYFESNIVGTSGGALTNGSKLTVLNSTFLNNKQTSTNTNYGGGAITFNGDEFKLIADGGDTYFSGNAEKTGSSSGTGTSNAIFLGSSASKGAQSINFNAGNGGSIIFDDRLRTREDDGREDIVVNLNKASQSYSSYANLAAGGTVDDMESPTDGRIVFNNAVDNTNLVLWNGTLAIADTVNSAVTQYFMNGSTLRIEGGTLDVMNRNIESGNKLAPSSITVNGDANYQFDVDLTNETSDYLNTTISGGGSITINDIGFSGAQDPNGDGLLTEDDLGKYVDYRIINQNNTDISLIQNLTTVITSDAGYGLELNKQNSAGTTADTLRITNIVNGGGLPVAVTIGKYFDNATYVYSATSDENISTWAKPFSVYKDNFITQDTAGNILEGTSLTINGNGYNIITTDNSLEGIIIGSRKALTINNVVGWKGFSSALINSGELNINDSKFEENISGTNGGAIRNTGGVVNILNTSFENNGAAGSGGAIYNENGTVNINAANLKTITFTGNGNDIYNSNAALNLAALGTSSSIIFNGTIDGAAASLNNNFVNIGYSGVENLGTIVFNDTVSNNNVTLNNGILEIGNTATTARDDYFNNVNFTVNGGTLDLQNGYLDTIKVNNLDVNNSTSILLDVSLSGNNQSDVIEVSGSTTGTGSFDIGSIQLQGSLAGGSTVITNFVNTVVNSTISDVNSTITYDGAIYQVIADSNRLIITKQGELSGYAAAVINSESAERSFQIAGYDEQVIQWIEGNNKLAGTLFQVNGGTDGKSIIGDKIIGVEVNNNQTLLMNNVSGYSGFDSALINNGGTLTISNSTLSSNNATSQDKFGVDKADDGGAIQNNAGTVTINAGTTFENNTATGNGGAIYNAATLNIYPTSAGEITFNNNSAALGNDIYQTSTGVTNILSSNNGTVTFNGGIAGEGTINTINTSGIVNIILNGDNSQYTGVYNQANTELQGVLTLNSGASFFNGESNIKYTTLNWYTNNDLDALSSTQKVTIDNSLLVVGDGTNQATLTIDGNNSITNPDDITINDNASLILKNNTATTNSISGTGTLQLEGDDASNPVHLTFSEGASLSGVKFVSSDAVVTIKEANSTNAILGAITSTTSTNSNLGLILEKTDASTDLTINGTEISSLTLQNGVNYVGKLTITGDGIVSSLAGDSRQVISGTVEGNGKITNSGNLIYNGDASAFTGDFTQSGGTTNVILGSKVFNGLKEINGGTFTVNSNNGLYYDNVELGNAGSFVHNESSNIGGTIDNDVLSFASSANGATATFNSTNSANKATFNLGSITSNGNANTISIVNSAVKLDNTDYTGSNIYNLNNSSLTLVGSPDELKEYSFTNLTTTGTNDLSFNVNFAKDASGTIYLDTDRLSATNGDAKFNLGDIFIGHGENEIGLETYTTQENVLSGSAEFNPNSTASGVDVIGATTAFEYEISVVSPDNQTIQMKATQIADENSLYKMNGQVSGNRFFQFSIGKTNEYHIGQSLSATLEGTFNVTGQSSNAAESVLSGAIVDSTGALTGDKGSFFNIASDVTTNLNISNLTVQDAEKTGNGSVVENNSATSTVTINNNIIKNNSATGDGGAIYNGAGITNISNTKFENNAADGNGGAVYNAGTLNLTNVELAAATATAKNDIYNTGTTNTFGTNTFNSDITNDGTLNLAGTNNVNGNFAGSTTASITNTGILNLNTETNTYAGGFTQDSGTTNVTKDFFAGTSTINNGTLNWSTESDLADGANLIVNNGNFNIGNNSTNANLTLKDGSSIAENAVVNLNKDSKLNVEGAEVSLNSNDTLAGTITQESGTINLNNIQGNGPFVSTGGKLNLNSGSLTIAQGSQITGDATDPNVVTLADGTTLNITGGSVKLDSNDIWNGNISLNQGSLTVDGLTSNGNIQAAAGDLNIINSGKLTIGENDTIASNVKTYIDTNSTIDITKGGFLQIDSDDTWNGTISLNDGTLNYNTNTSGTLAANTGNLNLLDGSVLTIQDPSQVKNEVAVDIQKGATVVLNNNSIFNLDDKDKWNGSVNNNGGHLTTTGLTNNGGGGLVQTAGSSTFTDNSHISIVDKNSRITGGDVSVLNNSSLYFGAGTTDLSVDNLTLGNNSSLFLMNGAINNVTASNMTVNGNNNVTVDLSPRDKIGDTFVINNLTTNSNGNLNISNFNFLGQAPIDREIKFHIFNADNIDSNVSFSATDKNIFTPIGNYQLFSNGGGYYTAGLTSFNPQVYRGQVEKLAMYNNQLMIDDMLLNHVTLQSERLLAQGQNANRYAATLPLFAPYQYKKEDGGLWFKSYVNFETLSMTQNLSVHNTAYGSLVGADFPVVNLKKGWKFLPTAYVAYNGSNQSFDGVHMYQNGGQGGFMGTFMKKDFIGSIVAYAGGYSNEMNVAGTKDTTGNWFAGTAAKAAYNLRATKHFTIQPTAFISYNIFGKTSWNSDFGAMGMNAGLLNGINVAPGVNLIYARETWSVYTTFQYMFNINDQISGRAGNVDLNNVEMRHGYFQYGIGATKTWKDRLSSYVQVTLRNGGRTGIGFQLGMQYLFDWNNPKGKNKKSTQAGNQTIAQVPVRKVIKQLSK